MFGLVIKVVNGKKEVKRLHANKSKMMMIDFCFEPEQEIDPLLDRFRFWIEGVVLSTVGTGGLIGNLMTSVMLLVLKKKRGGVGGRSRGQGDPSSFNVIVVSLMTVDSVLIMFMLLDSGYIRGFDAYEPVWYKVCVCRL